MGVRDGSALASLRAQIARIEGQGRRDRSVLPFGIREVDSCLPGGGLALGALHEVAGGRNGAIDGAAAALFAGGVAARTRGKVLWCLTRADLFAPALAQAGLAPDRVIHLEAGDERTVLACMEEGLRHGGLGAAVAEIARLSMSASRRLQLAAREGGTWGVLWRRPGQHATTATAALRLRLAPRDGELEIAILKRRGGPLAYPFRIDIDHAVGSPALPGSAGGDSHSRFAER